MKYVMLLNKYIPIEQLKNLLTKQIKSYLYKIYLKRRQKMVKNFEVIDFKNGDFN